MEPFLEHNPELTGFAEIAATVEWTGCYPLQQLGDQTAEPLSETYRDGKVRGDARAIALSLMSTAAKTERVFQRAATTDPRGDLAACNG